MSLGNGCGIGVGVAGSSAMSTGELVAGLQSIWGAQLSHLYIGENATVDESGNVTGVTATVGAALSYITSVKFPSLTMQGRKGFGSAYSADKRAFTTGATNVTAGSVVSVCSPGVLPFADYRFEVYIGTTEFLVGQSGASELYAKSGLTRYVNGTLTNSIASAADLAVLEGTTASPATGVLSWGGTNSAAVHCWQGANCFLAILSTAQSAQQRSDSLALLRKFYSIS